MKMSPRCTYCLLERVHFQCKLVDADLELTNKVMKECISVLNETYNPAETSTECSTPVHRKCYEILNNPDPYKFVKQKNNETALEILPFAKELIYGKINKDKINKDKIKKDGTKKETEYETEYETANFENSSYSKKEIFRRAALISVIGNYFDFGIAGQNASDEHFKKEFLNYFNEGFFVDDTEKIYEMLQNVVYLADNCGEIVFDREFIKIIRKLGGNVTLVVRGKPILTDATMEDVKLLKLDEYANKVLTTGTDFIGISLIESPKETIDAMKSASLIISKGMANYESLSDEDFMPIVYMLRTKCKSIAESIDVPLNKSVAKLYE